MFLYSGMLIWLNRRILPEPIKIKGARLVVISITFAVFAVLSIYLVYWYVNAALTGQLHTAKGGYRVYLVQAPHHVHVREHGQFPGSPHRPTNSQSFMVYPRRGLVAVRRSDSSSSPRASAKTCSRNLSSGESLS